MNTEIKASTIYLVRHGECESNVQEVYLPPEVDFITEKGRLQASLLGKSFKDTKFDKVYVSTYSRALETANGILEELQTPKSKIIIDERIREREMGIFENKTIKNLSDAVYSAWKEQGTTMLDYEVPDGESIEDFEGRIGSFLEDILKLIRESSKPQTILVISHGALIMRMLLKLRFWSKDTSRALTLNSFSIPHVAKTLRNTNYHVLSVLATQEHTAIDLVKVHCSDHLESIDEPIVPSKDQVEYLKAWKKMISEQCSMV